MAAIANDYAEVTTEQTRTGATTYADVSGAEIPSSSFVAGQKYLLWVRASMRHSSTSAGGRVRVAHGSTPFADSEWAFEPAVVANRLAYFWFHVWTAVASEKIVLQIATDSAAATTGADQITLFAMRLDADLTENTDWFFNEDTGDDDLSATFLNGGSVTFTPSQANQRWLCMTMAQHEPVGVAQQHESRMNLSGGTSFTGGLESIEPEDATNDIMFFSYARAFSLPASSHTLVEQSREEVEAGGSRLHSKAFALNLDKFKDVTQEFTAGPNAYSTTAWASVVEGFTHTKTVNGNVLILACCIDNYDAAADFAHHRLQVDNVDEPDTQTSDDYDYSGTNNDSTDQSRWALFTRENISANPVIDHDGYASNVGVDFLDSALVCFSMELAAAGVVVEDDTYLPPGVPIPGPNLLLYH